MAEFPALPLWTDAFMGDTMHLSAEQVGVYALLLFTAWRRPDCNLPDDDKFLAKIARCDGRKWRHLRPVMEQFHSIENGVWNQKRLQKERKYVGDLSKKMSEISNRRWNKNKDLVDAAAMQKDMPLQCTHTHTTKKENILSAAPQADHLDFEKFWQDYPREKNMSKKRALMAWKKLTPEKRAKAIEAVPGYRAYCDKNKSWYHTLHAERFLSHERFEGFQSEPVDAEKLAHAKDWADKYFKRGKYAENYK